MAKPRIGVPTNKRVFPIVRKFLHNISISPACDTRVMVVDVGMMEIALGRMSVIAMLLRRKRLDGGFLTLDHCKENLFAQNEILREFPAHCACTLMLVGQNTLPQFNNTFAAFNYILATNCTRPVMVTRFPNITHEFLGGIKEFKARVEYREESHHPAYPGFLRVEGSEELCICTGAADLAVCHVDTGTTMKENNLRVLDHILYSHLVFVGRSTPAMFDLTSHFS